MSTLVVTPTRSRPEKAYEAYALFEKNSSLEDTEMLWVLDANDPKLQEYYEITDKNSVARLWTVEYTGDMVHRTNLAAMDNFEAYDIIGWGADDLLFQTPEWDQRVEEAVDRGAILVGTNDLHYGEEKLQTAFLTKSAIRGLGYLCLPDSRHLYFDDAWTRLAERLGKLYRYLPDVVIEHAHPAYNKGNWDHQYEQTHQPENYARDRAAYELWLHSGGIDRDLKDMIGD